MRAFCISGILAILATTGAHATVAMGGFNVSLTVPARCSANSTLSQLAIQCSAHVPYSYTLAPANDVTTSQGSSAAMAEGRARVSLISDTGFDSPLFSGSATGRSRLAKRLAKLKADKQDVDNQLYIMSVVY